VKVITDQMSGVSRETGTKPVRGKIVIWLLATFLLTTTVYLADAQQPKKVPRIGYLAGSDPARESTRSEAIRLALRELGYVEGQNMAIEYRYAEGSAIGSLSLPPSWCVSRLISLWYQEGSSGRPRMRQIRFPSS
jgi:hypothetical protein